MIKFAAGIGVVLAVAYFSLPDARAWLLASAPVLLALACPLSMGAMMFMMKGKHSNAADSYCGDTYRVVTADGRTHQWWEFNLRFKTDGSADDPSAGKPIIAGNGMQGDRAAIVFSRPEDISTLVRRECP